MKKWSMIIAFGLAALLTACGGGGGEENEGSSSSLISSEGSSASGGAHSSEAATESKKAIAAVVSVLSRDFLGEMMTGLGDFTAMQPTRGVRELLPSQDCEGGGTMRYSIDEKAGTMSVSFDECKMGTETSDGEIDISGLSGTQTGGAVTYTLKRYMVTSADRTTLSNMTVIVKNGQGSLQSSDIEMTGKMEVETKTAVVRYMFEHFHVLLDGREVSIDGRFSISADPDSCGMSGTYDYETIEPLMTDRSGRIISGKLKINGDIYTFNADGTISVNGQTYSYEEIQQQCSADGM